MERGSPRRAFAGLAESTDLDVVLEGDADLGPVPVGAVIDQPRGPGGGGSRLGGARPAAESGHREDRRGLAGWPTEPGSAPVTSEERPGRGGATGRVRRLETLGVAALAVVALVSAVLVLAGDIAPNRGSSGRSLLRASAYREPPTSQRARAGQQAPIGQRATTGQQVPGAPVAGGSGPAEALVFRGGSTPPVESMGAWRALRMVVRAEHSAATALSRAPSVAPAPPGSTTVTPAPREGLTEPQG